MEGVGSLPEMTGQKAPDYPGVWGWRRVMEVKPGLPSPGCDEVTEAQNMLE